MYVTESKRPSRFKNKTKKVARLILSSVPYLLYCHIKLMTYVSAKVEKRIYNLMQRLDLLTNYNK